MKAILLAAVAIVIVTSVAFADTYVNGYTKSNGTYVQGHYRSDNDGNPSNNYSTYGNTNPYTGQEGTKHISPSYDSNNSLYNNYGSNNSKKSFGR